jgi:hypothetical protein
VKNFNIFFDKAVVNVVIAMDKIRVAIISVVMILIILLLKLSDRKSGVIFI